MFKKLLSFIVLALFMAVAASANGTLVGDLYYTFSGSNAIVTYTCDAKPDAEGQNAYTGDIVIPATINYGGTDYNVVEIGEGAFFRSTITSVVIPEGVLTINKEAFARTSLTSVIIPNSVETIKGDAFAYSKNLKYVTIGENVDAIGQGFCYSTAVTDVYSNIAGTIHTQVAYMFPSSARIHVPIGKVSSYTAKWTDYNIVADYNGVYYAFKGENATVTYPGNESEKSADKTAIYSGDIVIPETIDLGGTAYTVTTLGSNAFSHSAITSLDIPNSVTTIESDAAAYIGSTLTTVTIGSGLTSVGQGFCYDTNPTDVYIKTVSVPSGANYMFSGTPTIHVYDFIQGNFEAADYWNAYTYSGDLAADYNALLAKATEAQEYQQYVGTTPGYYSSESYAPIETALANFVLLNPSSPTSDINASMLELSNAVDAFLASAPNPITEGYYYFRNYYNETFFIYSDASEATTKGLKIKTIDDATPGTDMACYFKLIKNGDKWNIQCADNGMYWGSLSGGSSTTTTGKYVLLTDTPQYEQTITWTGLGLFKIQTMYMDGVTRPLAYSSSNLSTQNYSETSADFKRSQWYVCPAEDPSMFEPTITDEDLTIDGIKYAITGENTVMVTYPNEAQPSSGDPSPYSGEVTIPATITVKGTTFNVTAIGDYAFWGAGVTSLTLPEGITSLGYKSIYNTQITEITVPNSVVTMDYEALGYNTQLVTINFGENIATNTWGDKLCYNPSGTGLKKEVYMYCNSVPTLQSYTFSFADATVHVYPDLYDTYMANTAWSAYTIVGDLGVEDVSEFTVGGIKYKLLTENTVMVTYPNEAQPSSSDPSTYSGEIVIPAQVTYGATYNVTAIGDYAFWGAGVTSLTLPEGITSLGYKSIYNTQITEITVPNSVVTMDYEALGYNTQLVTINFGENIATNTWGDKLCYNPSGTGLKKEVYMYCDAVPTLQSYTFSFADATVHVYPSLYDAYMANTAWSAYTIIGDLGLDDVSEFTVDGIKYKRLSETDVYVTYPNEAQPSSSNPCTYSGEVVIPGQVSYGSHTYNVTAIGDYAFHFAPVTSLTLPEGITKLGYKAIYQTKLTEITVPNSVTLMDYEALGYNKQLVTIRFGENIAANKWGDKLCIYGDKKYEVYMNCNAVPQLQSYTFDFSGANVHVRPTMYSAFKADPVWSTYDIIGDLWIEYTYADLQAVLTNYAAPTGDAVGTDPGCYTNASVQALNDALAAGQTLDESATLEQLNTAINNIIIAYDALESVELQEGYYCIESLYKPGYALVTDAATADTEGIKTASYDATNAKFHFKLTRHGGNWYVQNVETGKYIGTAVGGNTNANPLSITDEPQYEQVITWVAGGAFKIQNIYSGTSATYPYRYYNYGVNVYNYGDGETRIHWRFHPVAPGTYPLDFNLENGRVRAFVHDFEYTAADGSKVGTYNVAPPDRRDQPVPATVFWTRDEASTAQQLTWSTDATFADATTVDVDNSSASYEIYNLIPGNTYYYKVTATVDGSETELINSTFTTSGQVRMIKADGVSNIRDLGGWPTESGYTVAYGKIFRGAAFTATSITPEGIEAVRATGVRAELDLRDSSQDGSMSASLLGTDVDYKRIALAQTASHMNGLTGSKNQYIQCVQYVLNCVKNDKPVYFHCAIGRDRTGTLAFLLQGVLGMSKSDIYKDYELTNFSNLNTPCSKTQLDEMFTMIEGLEGATMEDKFYTYLTTELGISAADIDEYKAKMLNLPSALTPAEVQTMVSEAAAAGSTTLDLTGYDFNGDVSAADMQAPGTNLMVIVDPASGITGQNIISDGTCESLVLTDGQPFAPGMEFTATTATYATTVADGVWYSAVLPYDFAIPEGVQVAANASLSGTTVTLEQLSGNVPANTPFIYKKDGGGDITFAATDATVAAADEPVSGVLKGTYAGIPAESAAGMLTLQGEGATFAVTSTSISAFSAYLDSGQEADAYDILIDDPTGVQSMVNRQSSIVNGQSVYDLNGRKLPANSHVRGIVIVNGKKVLKK